MRPCSNLNEQIVLGQRLRARVTGLRGQAKLQASLDDEAARLFTTADPIALPEQLPGSVTGSSLATTQPRAALRGAYLQ